MRLSSSKALILNIQRDLKFHFIDNLNMASSRKRMKLWVTAVSDVSDHTLESPRSAHSEADSPRSTEDGADIEQESDHRSVKLWPAEQTGSEAPLQELSEDGLSPDGSHATTPRNTEQFEPASPTRTGRISVENENSSDYPPSVSWESDYREPLSPMRTRQSSVENEHESDYPGRMPWQIGEMEPDFQTWKRQDSESGDDSDNPSIMSWEGGETASASGRSTRESWENFGDPEEWETQLASLLMFFRNSMERDIIHCYGMVKHNSAAVDF